MNTSSPTRSLQQLLTEENLSKLQRRLLSPSLTPSLSSRAPILSPTPSERLENAKRPVVDAIKSLWDLVCNSRHEEHHRRRIREILKTDELRITRTRHSAIEEKKGRKPDLEDPMYWKAKLQELRAKYADIKRQTPPPPPLVQPDQAKEWVYNIIKALEIIGDENTWALRNSNLYIAGENDVRYGSGDPEPDPASWMAEVQRLGECYALESRRDETRPAQAPVTLEEAKELVFNAMWALELNPEGRRVLQDDEFYIAGWNDVRCRDHHRIDPAYWMDRLKYFNDKRDDIWRWDSRRSDGQARVFNEIQRLIWDHGRSGLLFLLRDELYFDMAAESICYRGDNGYDARYQGRKPPDLEDPAYWDRRLQDFKAKNEQAGRKSPSNCIFTFAELDELEEIEKAKKAHQEQLVDDEFGRGNRIEEGIQQWVTTYNDHPAQHRFQAASWKAFRAVTTVTLGALQMSLLSTELGFGMLIVGSSNGTPPTTAFQNANLERRHLRYP
ncbi:hypothetical protein CDV36_014068 [Fusarium kuroshium]|uniref:Uncharacterized protein n=1 Tax=Fusarium kuroshium TaxID=2010991 RepID=A0A3M2RJ54_9HYPO|nr:hypothetical protein CDV36_014068 [Fusarium kuroshium]